MDNSISQALLINNGSSGNTFYSNKIISSTTAGLKINQDSTSKNNIFYNNQITRSSIGGNATADPNTEASDIKHKIRK